MGKTVKNTETETEAESLRHLLISASAGSGKTFQLVRRYMHLLALDQEAEGIAAMTFTRKAAGEFFNRILRRLAELATKPEGAAGYFEGLRPRLAGQPDFQAILRNVTRRMHRLRLGTMDSFFASMSACFPLELGLPAGARVMDEDESTQARRETLDALLERLYIEDETKALQELQEAHKQATFGAEEKTVDASLQDWASTGLSLWADTLDSGVGHDGWGNVYHIWGAKGLELMSLEDAISGVRQHFLPPHPAGQDLLEETLLAVLETEPGLTPPKRVKDLFEKLEPQWEDLLEGRGELMWMRKKLDLTGAPARVLRVLVQTLIAREFVVRARRTQGLATVLAMFEEEYGKRVRARGRLSFADVQRLLSKAAKLDSPWLGGAGDLWFRMDGKYQHWLIDEFQDTSRVQWQVIGELVDEVIQDDGGERSFFAVGDPKQSIYLWRQAEPDLFDDVLREYPAQGELGLHRQPLSKSYRSAQPVLDAVNAVCGNAYVLDEMLPPGSLKGFAFQDHEASQTELSGYAALLSPPVVPNKEDQTSPLEVTAALLQEIQPIRRGLSCAILVRQNKDARTMAEELRAITGQDIVCESDQHPTTDNAVTLALLSLLTLAAHPGDTQALEHLRMTPLWALVEEDGKSWRYRVAMVQSQVFEQGFADYVEEWARRIQEMQPMDAFHGLRLAQLADIAAEFDGTGSRDIDAFLDFAKEYPLRTRGARQAVQVMTVHAAKGLEFDVVILPTLDGTAMDEVRRSSLLVSRNAGEVQWVLQTPPRQYAQLDPVLNKELVEAKRRAAFEALCRLYVAMTRAKRGLYMVADVAPRSGRALKESRLLRETLGGTLEEKTSEFLPKEVANIEWETGQPQWWAICEEEPMKDAPEVAVPKETLGKILKATQPIPRRRTPSGEEAFTILGSALFSPGREPGRRLGSLVHELFARVEWWDASAPEWSALEKRWTDAALFGGDALDETAMEMVKRVLGSPESAQAFVRPSPHAVVWRELPFDLVMKTEWVSGIFDRVVVDRDAAGKAVAAWIVDFKTDDVPTAEAMAEKVKGYQPQIALYREAIERLTGLGQGAIRASLLFTRVGRLAEVGTV